jgi:hypothetical protein
MAAELNGKRLEILRDINADLRHVAIVTNSEHQGVHLESCCILSMKVVYRAESVVQSLSGAHSAER